MFKIKKKKLIYSAVSICCVVSLALLIPAIKTPFLNLLKNPLVILTLLKREVRGLIFYHRNFIQNEKLIRQADLLEKKLNESADVYLENKRLQSLLSFKENSPYKVIAARVIGSGSDAFSSLVIIDKGSSQGIRRGFVAVSYLGLIGRVVEASGSTSKVMLINDPNLSVSARVLRSRQEGLVSGSLSGSLNMRYLPADSDIKISDTIVTSGLSQAYPKGIIIGRVSGLGEEYSGLSRYAIIKPAVNLYNLEELLIIIP